MSYVRRKQLILSLLLIVIISSVILFWRFIPFAILATLWTQVDIRDGIIVALVSAGIIGLVALIFKPLKNLVVPDKTDAASKPESYEQIYLENFIAKIADTFKRDSPWDVKKYTDLEAVLKEQEQHARIVQTHLWRLPGTQTTSTETNLGVRVNIQSFLRSKEEPIMIKGEPGTGKTLTVLRFAVDQATKAKNSESGKVQLPIYIRLSAYTGRTMDGNPEPVFDFIKNYLKQEYPEAIAIYDNLNDYLIRGRLVLLFDGLNELPPDEYLPRSDKLEEFIAKYPLNKAIFTCRTPRYTPQSKFVTVEISDLDDAQIKRFIAAYNDEQAAETLYQDLTSGDGFMLRICRNPFMLRMLVTRNSNRPVPETPAQLFHEYVHDQLETVSQHALQTADVLRSMAFEMQKGGQFAGAVAYNWLKTQLPNVDLDEHLQVAHQINLLNYTSEKDIRFYHQILQEYFAATALKETWLQGEGVAQYFSDYRWEDTILVCAGLIDNVDQPDQTDTFVRDIWSPGQNEPERFWLATKTVGSCGRRVSTDYYDAVIEQATKNLTNRLTTSSLGYSRTALAVGTVKALSYIDDKRTAKLMSDTLTNVDGWVRELCIQVLGRSRQEYAHNLLRDAIVKQHSFSALMLVAPYFNRAEWLTMIASSTITSGRLTTWFWQATQYLWLLAPGVYLGLLVIGSQIFKVDPIVLFGRVVALSIFMQFLVHSGRKTIGILRTQKVGISKGEQFKDLFLSELFSIVIVILCWFFPNETLSLGGLLLFLLLDALVLTLAFTLLLTLFKPRQLALILYAPFSRAMMITVGVIITGRASIFLFPAVWHTPANFHVTNSPVAAALEYVSSLLFYGTPALTITGIVALIGTASIIVHLITYGKYRRIRQYCDDFKLKGDVQAAQALVRIILNPTEWPFVRARAIKSLNLIRLPTRYINDLDALLDSDELQNKANDNWLQSLRSFFETTVDLRRDLERAVSELIERAREEEREAPDAQYLSMLIKRATERYEIGYSQEALTYLNHVITLDGKNTAALFLRGKIYYAMRNYDSALADFNRIIVHNPQDGPTIAYRGATWYNKNDYIHAFADLEQSITLGQKDSWIFNYRGDIQRLWGLYSEALADFNQGLAGNTDDARFLLRRGITLRQMEKYPEALADLNHALNINNAYPWKVNNSESWWALLERSIVYRRMGQYPEALTDINDSIRLYEQDDWAYYQRALVSLLQNRQDLFEEDINQAIHYAQKSIDETQNTPDKVESNMNMSLFRLVHGEETEAQAQYEQIRTHCSDMALLQEAVEDLTDFLTVQPDHQLARQIHDQFQAHIQELKSVLAAVQ